MVEYLMNDTPNDGSFHALGNGRLCVYARGPEVSQFFGPPYSAPSAGSLGFATGNTASGSLSVATTRERGTALWSHRIESRGSAVGELGDFVDSSIPVFVRTVRTSVPLALPVQPSPGVHITRFDRQSGETARTDGLLLRVPAGAFLYGAYPIPWPMFYAIVWSGQITHEEHSRRLVAGPGESCLYIVGGPSYPECIRHTEEALAAGAATLRDRTRRSWLDSARASLAVAEGLPENTPHRDRLVEAVDSIGVVIKTQQAREGGVLAGYPYHLGYVRDQYGVSRGLLALDRATEARDVLRFYWNVWQREGRLHNAQGLGVPGVFHVHENDHVEITGYLTVQAFDYLRKTNDEDFIDEIFPMLEWAFDVQGAHLAGGMLPFNGDETYVAGGILPRTALNDGSAEATMLFVEGGRAVIDWAATRGHWTSERTTEALAMVEDTASAFRGNFIKDGELITNNPRRAAVADLPRFRHGVCEGCPSFGWTERNANDRYLCPDCIATRDLPRAEPRTYVLQSVTLTPFYFGSALVPETVLRPAVDRIVKQFSATGKLPSRPDGDRCLGYDYGLLLCALAALGRPEGKAVYGKMLDVLDNSISWCEYYTDHRPDGTRYRPWESAINIEAAVAWARGR